MDIFKLLARSTNLKTSTAAVKGPLLPSCGAPANPQLYGDEVENGNGLVVGRGKKRKRGRDTAGDGIGEEAGGVPGELDFFAERSSRPDKAQKEASRESQGIEHDGDDDEDAGEGDSEEEEVIRDLDEAECRRILKAHKLKITLLLPLKERGGAPEEAGSKSRKKTKKGKDSAEGGPASHKKTPVLLFPQPLTSFDELRPRYKIARRLAENISGQEYRIPTEVQLGSLPLLLGSNDDGVGFPLPKEAKRSKSRVVHLLTVAPTGSGKTLAYLIPVLDGLIRERRIDAGDDGNKRDRVVRAVVIAPTKELADQILNEARKLVVGTGIKVTGMHKGMKLTKKALEEGDQVVDGRQNGHDEDDDDDDGEDSHDSSASESEDQAEGVKKRKPRHGQLVKADLVISTPLILLHALSTTNTEPPPGALQPIRYLVLDEADVLLDPLFRDQTLSIWSLCTNPLLRITFWSATMGSSIESLVQSTLTNRHKTLALKHQPYILRLIVGLKDSALPNISHRLVYCATEAGKLIALRQLLHPTSHSTNEKDASLRPPFLVFTQTITRATALHAELLYDIPTSAGGPSRIAVLHSSLSSTLRSSIMARFRAGEIWVLITTDLLARGIDFRGMNGVVNYDIPVSGAGYVHRVGRTGRAGRGGGVAVTFWTKEDVAYVKNIANIIARAEKAWGGAGEEGGGKAGIGKWLLDGLPTPTKEAKKKLKRRGVEERRDGDKRGRISTKSGFDRRVAHNRKGMVKGARRQSEDAAEGVRTIRNGDADAADEGEWDGFED